MAAMLTCGYDGNQFEKNTNFGSNVLQSAYCLLKYELLTCLNKRFWWTFSPIIKKNEMSLGERTEEFKERKEGKKTGIKREKREKNKER